jgi:sulfate adenylyltransferase subunit 1 (EFTu-like GTPase family)
VFEDAQWAVDGEHFYHPRLGSSYQAGDYICEGSLVREASRWKAIYLHFSDSCAQIDTGVNWVRRFESHKVTGFKVLRVFNLESLQFEDRSCLEGLQFNGIYEIEITISQKTLSRNYQDSKDLGSFILGDKELLGAGMIIEA